MAPNKNRRGGRPPRRAAQVDEAASFAPPHHDRPAPGPKTSSGAFGTEAFGSSTFGGPLNTQPLNQPGAMQRKHAPESVPDLPLVGGDIDAPEINSLSDMMARHELEGLARSAPSAAAGQPPAPDPAYVSQPVLTARTTPQVATSSVSVSAIQRNRTQISLQLRVLITAFQEVEEYDPKRHHNQPPPSLWIAHPDYQRDVKIMLRELRALNGYIARMEQATKAEKKIAPVTKMLTTFAEKYVGALATSLGALTAGAIGLLLIDLGVPHEVVNIVLGHIKPK